MTNLSAMSEQWRSPSMSSRWSTHTFRTLQQGVSWRWLIASRLSDMAKRTSLTPKSFKTRNSFGMEAASLTLSAFCHKEWGLRPQKPQSLVTCLVRVSTSLIWSENQLPIADLKSPTESRHSCSVKLHAETSASFKGRTTTPTTCQLALIVRRRSATNNQRPPVTHFGTKISQSLWASLKT